MGRSRYDYRRDIEALEVVLRPFQRPGFFFVNVGACDGVMGDPIYPFARKYGWRGILVEPVPHVFEQLRSNYADIPDVVLENVVVATEQRPFWYVAEGSASLQHAVSQVGSIDREHLLLNLRRLQLIAPNLPRRPHHLAELPPVGVVEYGDDAGIDPQIEQYVRRADVECISFNALMERHAVDQVDFVNIDAEGADYDILCSIDFERYGPRVLCLETSSFSDEVKRDCSAMLDDLGYTDVRPFGVFSRVFTRAADV